MDSLRYWVIEMHVDGFRFDLASALARELHEVDQLGGVLRHHPPGPGPLAGEADRRAVGPRRGRLPGGQLPRRCGPSGTASTATRVRRFWQRRRRRSVRVRHALWPAAATCTSRAAGARTPASTSSPATTASRCRTWSATTTSTTRPTARTTATATTTTSAGTAARKGPTDDPGDPRAARAAEAEPLATLLLSQGVPMIRAGDELGHTQRRQQQRLLPGQRDHLARLGPDPRAAQLPRLHAPGDPVAPEQPVLRRRRFFQGRSIRGAASRTSPGSIRTAGR